MSRYGFPLFSLHRMTPPPKSFRRFQIYTLGLWAAGIVVLLVAILGQTRGASLYSLDDPYIHLALAEELLRGNFGINPGEVASPSSSMLYAPLLALLGAGPFAPLVLTLIGQGLALWILSGLVAPTLSGSRALFWLMGPVLTLAINAFGLPLTGMEHALHVAASLAILAGLARVNAGQAAPWWLVLALVMAPALRFEGFALSLCAMAALIWMGQRQIVLIAALALAGLCAAYVATMVHFDLPLMPSSVMVKSSVSSATLEGGGYSALVALIVNGILSLTRFEGLWLGLVALVCAGLALRSGRMWPVALPVLVALLAQICVGRFGWFGRYEVYAVAMALALLALLARERQGWLVLVASATIATIYAPITWRTPDAALAVYEQQHQMHRFATQVFPEPVAVNDIGWVAYRNDGVVRDLWGLGSEHARQLTAAHGRTVETTRALTQDGIVYAMIYDQAFNNAIPPEWCRMGVLHTRQGAAASDEVGFWLIDRAQEARFSQALAQFDGLLPAGASLTRAPCSP